MAIQDEWAADAAEILAEIPKAVTVRKAGSEPVALNVLMSQPMLMQDLETGGFTSSTSYDVKFIRTDYVLHSAVIAHGSVITFNSEDLRVVAVVNRPPSSWVICRVQTLVQ